MKYKDRVAGIKLTPQDIETASKLVDSPFFPFMERVRLKLLRLHKDLAFKLKEDDPEFIHKHRSYAEQAYGIRSFLQFIYKAAKKGEED